MDVCFTKINSNHSLQPHMEVKFLTNKILKIIDFSVSQENTAPVSWIWSKTEWDFLKTCKKVH